MENTPYISVIIPMYNVENYIKLCVDSILAQTFQDFEIVIVDDVSTDNSYNLCRKLYAGNKKIRIFRNKKNLGSGRTRNLQIKDARGKYIWFVDSDDAVIPTALEKLYNAAQPERGVDVVHIKGWYTTKQDDGKPMNIEQATLNREGNVNCGLLIESIPRRLAENWIVNRIVGLTVGNLCKRKFLLENEIEFPDCLSEDQVFALALMCLAKKYFMLDDAVYIYRKRENHLGRAPKYSYGADSLVVIQNSIKKILDKIPELDNNRIFKEQCAIKMFEVLLRDYARHFYDGINISPEMDKIIYDALLPIFGENTALVKYLFHGYNTMWRQTNILATQNYLLRQRDELIKQQNKILEQMNVLLAQQSEQLKRD